MHHNYVAISKIIKGTDGILGRTQPFKQTEKKNNTVARDLKFIPKRERRLGTAVAQRPVQECNIKDYRKMRNIAKCCKEETKEQKSPRSGIL